MKKKKAPKPREKTTNVALPNSIHARLRAVADENRQPISFLAAQAVQQWLEKRTAAAA